MTRRLEQLPINGIPVWVETDELEVVRSRSGPGTTMSGKIAPTSSGGAAVAADALTSVDLQRTLTALIEPVHKALLASKPKEVTLELSLGLKGEVGFFVAKSEGTASVKVTAKWGWPSKPTEAAEPEAS